MVVRKDNEEIVEIGQASSLEEAIELARKNMKEGSELFLISEDAEGREVLIPLEVEKENAN